jgi:hypothetical protein
VFSIYRFTLQQRFSEFYQPQWFESTPNISSPLSVVGCVGGMEHRAYCPVLSGTDLQNQLNYADALAGANVEVRFNGRISGGF